MTPSTAAGRALLRMHGCCAADEPCTVLGDLPGAIPRIEAEAAADERARLAELVLRLPLRGLTGEEGPAASLIGRAAVLALLDPQP